MGQRQLQDRQWMLVFDPIGEIRAFRYQPMHRAREVWCGLESGYLSKTCLPKTRIFLAQGVGVIPQGPMVARGLGSWQVLYGCRDAAERIEVENKARGGEVCEVPTACRWSWCSRVGFGKMLETLWWQFVNCRAKAIIWAVMVPPSLTGHHFRNLQRVQKWRNGKEQTPWTMAHWRLEIEPLGSPSGYRVLRQK